MPVTLQAFHPESWAQTYAERHYVTDPGILEIYFLPEGSPSNEIRLVEVNQDLIERVTDPSEALTLGVDLEGTQPHYVSVVDVTPNQWKEIEAGRVALPDGWSILNRKMLKKAGSR